MKVTFETDDKIEINQLTKAGDMALSLWKINQLQFMNTEKLTPAQIRMVKIIGNEITNILDDKGINLNELID